MAIQVPRIERFNVQETPSIGRANLNLPDQSAPIEMVGKSVEHAVHTVGKAYEAAQKHAADTKTDEIANRFNVYANNLLSGPDGARYKDGDPVPVYSSLDENVNAYKSKLIQENDNLTDDGKILLNKKLNRAHQTFNIKKDISYGSQYDKYDTKVTKDSVELMKNDMLESAGLIDPNKPESIAPFNEMINRIKQTRINSAIRKGRVQADENGRVKQLDPVTGLEIAKDLSDGLYDAIGAMNAQKNPDGARFIMENYKDYIDPVHTKKALKDIETTETQVKADNLFANVAQLDPSKAIATLENEKDVEVQVKARKMYDDLKRQEDNIRMRSSRTNYNAAFDIVHKRMQSDSPFVSVDDLERDPTVKPFLKNITDPTQKKALYKMVTPSEDESDPDALAKVMNLIKDGGTIGMDFKDFSIYEAGLSKEHRRIVESQWKKDNTESDSQERSRMNFVLHRLEDRLKNTPSLIKYGRDGKLTKSSKQYLDSATFRFMRQADSFPKGTSVQDIENTMEKFIGDEIKKGNEKQGSSWWSSLFGSSKKVDTRDFEPVPTPKTIRQVPNSPLVQVSQKQTPVTQAPVQVKPAPTGVSKVAPPAQPTKMDAATMIQQREAFKKAKGRTPNDLNELKSFMQGK